MLGKNVMVKISERMLKCSFLILISDTSKKLLSEFYASKKKKYASFYSKALTNNFSALSEDT